jgi:predicted transcriptional regulator
MNSPSAWLFYMEISLHPEQAKLTRLAAEQGRASEALVVEAIERLVNYDEWFLREVNKGIEAADRGELMEDADVRKMIDQRYPK